jgi:hypothetical protein
MRFRLALALSLSGLLILGAFWSRFSTTKYVQSEVITVEQSEISNGYDEELLAEFLKPKTSTTTIESKPLSNTELIGRGLVLDYVSLATKGQATEANLASLANKYVGGVPNSLNKATVINISDLQTVPKTKNSLQNYADQITSIHQVYATSIIQAQKGKKVQNLTALNPDLYFLTAAFAQAYTEAANKLRNLPVPLGLVSSHLKLTNSYFSSASAMKALSETEKDSASAFAGLLVLNGNLKQESLLLTEISQILTSNGI